MSARNDPPRSMLLVAGFSNFDRFAVGPMLFAFAATFSVSVSTAAAAATAYFISYGVSQPVWGVLSDRYGRIRVIRIGLTVGAVGSALSAMAPSILLLSTARALTGAAFGALIPATITFIGDTVDTKCRQAALADMLAAMAVGSALATAMAGAVAEFTSWRVLFAAVTGVSVAALLQLSGTKETLLSTTNPAHPLARVGMVLRSRWALLVMVFAFLEGGLVLGLFALLPSVIEQHGPSAASAGAIAAAYGVSMLAATRAVKRISSNPLIPLAIGGAALIIAHAVPSVIDGVAPLVVTAILLGIVWAAFHSSLQTWMTTTVPEARATCVALMTSALFLGSGAGTAIGGRLLDAGHTKILFACAALLSAVVVTSALIARKRYVSVMKPAS
ncbi:MAG: MFS transporter [Acidimicrobiales bacterium]|nr:MAG: MFS transporter [Acidimicrobiales bacterium]